MMAQYRRRLLLKPVGLKDGDFARLTDALNAAIEQQKRLAAQSPFILRLEGALRPSEAGFFVEHEPAAPLPISACFDPDAPAADKEQLLNTAAALFEALRVAHAGEGGRPAVHGGLCLGSLLIDEFGVVKVTDFGFAAAINKMIGEDRYLNLAVRTEGTHADGDEISAVWEFLTPDEYTRDDRLCPFLAPEKSGQLSAFETGSDIFAAGLMLHLLAEHRHPYLFTLDPQGHRLVDLCRVMGSQLPTTARRKDLRESQEPAIKTWCEVVRQMFALLPQERPSARTLLERLAPHVQAYLDRARQGDELRREADRKKAERAAQIAAAQDAARGWCDALRQQVEAQDWQAAADWLRQAPSLEHGPPEVVEYKTRAEREVQERLQAIQREIESHHKQARAWLEGATAAAQKKQWQAALDALAKPPALQHWPEEVRAGAAKLEQLCRQKLEEERDAKERERLARARELVRAFVQKLLKDNFRPFLDPELLKVGIGSFQWSSDRPDANGRAQLTLQFQEAAQVPGAFKFARELHFQTETAPPRLCDEAELQAAAARDLTQQLVSLQKNRLDDFLSSLRGGLFPSLDVNAALDQLTERWTATLDLGRGETAEGKPEAKAENKLSVELRWNPKTLRWDQSDADGFAARAAEIALAAVRRALAGVLLKQSKELDRYRKLLTLEATPAAPLAPGALPRQLALEGRLGLRPGLDREPQLLHTFPFAYPPLEPGAFKDASIKAEAALRQIVTAAQDGARQAFQDELEKRLQTSKAKVKLAAPKKLKEPADTLTFELKPSAGQPLTLTLSWKIEPFAYERPAEWEPDLNKLLVPPEEPKVTQPPQERKEPPPEEKRPKETKPPETKPADPKSRDETFTPPKDPVRTGKPETVNIPREPKSSKPPEKPKEVPADKKSPDKSGDKGGGQNNGGGKRGLIVGVVLVLVAGGAAAAWFLWPKPPPPPPPTPDVAVGDWAVLQDTDSEIRVRLSYVVAGSQAAPKFDVQFFWAAAENAPGAPENSIKNVTVPVETALGAHQATVTIPKDERASAGYLGVEIASDWEKDKTNNRRSVKIKPPATIPPPPVPDVAAGEPLDVRLDETTLTARLPYTVAGPDKVADFGVKVFVSDDKEKLFEARNLRQDVQITPETLKGAHEAVLKVPNVQGGEEKDLFLGVELDTSRWTGAAEKDTGNNRKTAAVPRPAAPTPSVAITDLVIEPVQPIGNNAHIEAKLLYKLTGRGAVKPFNIQAYVGAQPNTVFNAAKPDLIVPGETAPRAADYPTVLILDVPNDAAKTVYLGVVIDTLPGEKDAKDNRIVKEIKLPGPPLPGDLIADLVKQIAKYAPSQAAKALSREFFNELLPANSPAEPLQAVLGAANTLVAVKGHKAAKDAVSFTITVQLAADAGECEQEFTLRRTSAGRWEPDGKNADQLKQLRQKIADKAKQKFASNEAAVKTFADNAGKLLSAGQLAKGRESLTQWTNAATQARDALKALKAGVDVKDATAAEQALTAYDNQLKSWNDTLPRAWTNALAQGYQPGPQRDGNLDYPVTLTAGSGAGATTLRLVNVPPNDPIWSQVDKITGAAGAGERPWLIFYIEEKEQPLPVETYAAALQNTQKPGANRDLPTRTEWLLAALKAYQDNPKNDFFGGKGEWCKNDSGRAGGAAQPVAEDGGPAWACGCTVTLSDGKPFPSPPANADALQSWLMNPLVCQRRAYGDGLVSFRAVLRMHAQPLSPPQ